jgi:DNA mismatch repair protein MutS2
LGTAVIDHFRRAGAHLIATTHYDSLKSYASTTEGVVSAAFGFNPETFAPTYRLAYGSPGRSLAIEIAARLGMPQEVIAAARLNLTDREKQLAEHLARVDADLRALEQERQSVARERATVADSANELRTREEAIRAREEAYRRRLDAKLDDQLRTARREIDSIIDTLKARAAELAQQAARQLHQEPRLVRTTLSTGDTGAVRADARTALERVATRVKGDPSGSPGSAMPPKAQGGKLSPGVRVAVGTLGLEGVVIQVHGSHAEIAVRGKRLRAALRDLSVIGAPPPGEVRVNVDLQPREQFLAELNVIGLTVDEALTRTEKFLDESTVTDQHTVRVIHGHGTGQLRRAIGEFLKTHPLVARFEAASPEQGGTGVTVVELKD